MNVIFNPRYTLKNDGKRMLLTNKNKDFFEKEVLVFLHPDHAKLLSFFDGAKSFEESLNDIAHYFGISVSEAEHLARMFMSDAPQTVLKYQGSYFFFPKSVLIKNEENTIRHDLQSIDYSCEQPYDFESSRLKAPLSVLFVSTMKCFTDCEYCYADKLHHYNRLPTSRILEIIEECREIGVRDIDVTGGEFLLHPDWKVILTKLLSEGYSPEISTKIPITEETISFLLSCGTKSIQFSLDTLDDEIASLTLKTKKGYVDKMIKSIRSVDQAGMRIVIKPTLTKRTCTIENISEIMDFCDSLKNIDRLVIGTANYSRFKNIQFFKTLYPEENVAEECQRYVEHRQALSKYRILANLPVENKKMFCNEFSFRARNRCTGNIDGCALLPDGKVVLCEELYWHPAFMLGDVSETSFAEVWGSEKAISLWRIRQDNISKASPCFQCNSFSGCREKKGVCYKLILEAYGEDHYQMPDPRCPKAPKPIMDYGV